MKTTFKTGSYKNAFSITPFLQITYCAYYPIKKEGFAIELGWGKWAVGVKFSKS